MNDALKVKKKKLLDKLEELYADKIITPFEYFDAKNMIKRSKK